MRLRRCRSPCSLWVARRRPDPHVHRRPDARTRMQPESYMVPFGLPNSLNMFDLYDYSPHRLRTKLKILRRGSLWGRVGDDAAGAARGIELYHAGPLFRVIAGCIGQQRWVSQNDLM